MDGQFMELWGRWLTTAFQGPNQMDMMSGWLRSFNSLSSLNNPFAAASNMSAMPNYLDSMQQAWEPLLKMQQNSMQWMGMVPKGDFEAISDRAEELEIKVKEQARTIERLQKLLSQTGGENNVVVTQLQDLIGEQSKQFKQLTQSVGDYIKSGTEKVSAKK